MLAHALLAVATATERDVQPTLTGLIALTANESRRLFHAPSWPPTTPSRPCWPDHDGADDTNTAPDNPTTGNGKINHPDLRLQY